jgi:hypothetical protein
MSWQRTAGSTLWTLAFLGFGFLPALLLAGLSLFLSVDDPLGKLLSALAWAGTAGLLLATRNRPGRTESPFLLVIVALLVMGIVAMATVLPMAPTEMAHMRSDLAYWVISAMMFGPVLLALLYIGLTLRPERPERYQVVLTVLCIAGSTALFHALKPSPPTQVIEETASAAEVALIVEAPPRTDATMGLEHLARIPYSRIRYNGRDYRPLPHRARLSVPSDGAPPRYVVTEQVAANPQSERWPVRVTWTLEDRQRGTVMARRELWRRKSTEWSADTPRGWQGDNAARFVQQVLHPEQSWQGRSRGYRRADFSSETIAPLWLSQAEKAATVSGCDGRIEIAGQGTSSRVQSLTPDWWFEPLAAPARVFCVGEQVYVISGILANEIRVDRLDSQGRFIEQFQFLIPQASMGNGFLVQHVSSLSVEEHGLDLQVAFFRKYPEPTEDKPAQSDLALRIRSQ